mmetsp:Transcript_17267/g.16477  ORF Transcript_17267/g.16477 Transcript_17267/m.16477 type:complete len:207 (-) Transcript_17267:45-665(-)
MQFLFGYLGVFLLSTSLDACLRVTDSIDLLFPIILLNIFFSLQLYLDHKKRQQVQLLNRKNEDLEGAALSNSLMSRLGLTTLFNAMTQTTTTLCANGQCFTIYSNTISSNLAAFGVSVTSINTYLIPLCLLLLSYSVWCLYREERSLRYRPFLLGLAGAFLIILDNFILGQFYDLKSIPAWTGNGFLIVAAIWASRDMSQKHSSPF